MLDQNAKGQEQAACAVEAKRVVKTFGHQRALRGLDLKVAPGEALTIFGPNGAGKTTILKVLATLMRPSSGSVCIDGFDVLRDAAAVRRRLGVVSHQTFLYDELTAYENLRFYGKMYDVPHLDERVGELLERVGLHNRRNDRVRGYSRGMQQRLSIARALIHDPMVLLLDEPETGLDKSANAILREVMGAFPGNGRTLVMATHALERGLDVASRVAIMYQGKIVFDQPRSSLDLASLLEAYDYHTRPAQ